MSLGKTADDGNVFIFTKDGVTIHKEEDVLITCHKNPILIGKRDERGRYRIPLTQDHGQWQTRRPTKAVRRQLHLEHSIYDLPSKEEAVKWIHAFWGYTFKSTYIKSIKASNYIGWPVLNKQNVAKYYPDTNETPKGPLNQSRTISGLPNLNTLPSRCPKQLHSKDTRHVTYTQACTK